MPYLQKYLHNNAETEDYLRVLDGSVGCVSICGVDPASGKKLNGRGVTRPECPRKLVDKLQ